MHIDSYRFGSIVIDGKTYNNDCLIVGGTVKDNWWRTEGHLLKPEDLEEVIAAKPAVLIIGCGAYGVMKISPDTMDALRRAQIMYDALKTDQAVDKFNEHTAAGRDVAAALHLTS